MKVLLVVTHDGQNLHPQMLSVISAVKQLTQDYDCVVLGYQCTAVAKQAAQLPGVGLVYHIDNSALANSMAENMVDALHPMMTDYDAMVFASNTFSKNILPRLAVALDISPITDVASIVDQDTFKRPIYAGNAIATVKTKQAKNILSIRTASFMPCAFDLHASTSIKSLSVEIHRDLSKFVGLESSASDRPDLSSAKRVVSGGRGLGSSENFSLIEDLAKHLGAAVGASRAAVDAGFVPNDYQVGQTGKIISPDIYIAIGISGAVQHLAGMKDARIIIAIDKDEDAPIFQVADYGLVADLFDAIPELQAYVTKQSQD